MPPSPVFPLLFLVACFSGVPAALGLDPDQARARAEAEARSDAEFTERDLAEFTAPIPIQFADIKQACAVLRGMMGDLADIELAALGFTDLPPMPGADGADIALADLDDTDTDTDGLVA